jgi:hypothetical protein
MYQKSKTKNEWSNIIEEYKRSGLNKTEFCRQNNINKSTFYIWSEVLEELEENNEEGRFIPISVKGSGEIKREEEIREIRSRVAIEGENGLRVEFKYGCKVSEIKAIASILVC